MPNVKESNLTLSKQALVFTCLTYNYFEKTVGKGEISPFPTVYSILLENFPPFPSNLKLSVWEGLKFVVGERSN